jgi:glycerol-3-phosphate dehydrogenase subunit B
VIYDCLIIGGGIAGLTCGIKCASHGLHTAIISGGMNSLHFSSGSIDIAGYTPAGDIVKKPFEYIKKLAKENSSHPYTKTGLPGVRESIRFITEKLSEEGITLNNNDDLNHFHITALGTLKPTYLSQESVFSTKVVDIVNSGQKLAILNFKGFRDYYPEQTAANLKKNTLFKNTEIILGNISLPYYMNTEKNLHEFRSIDIARIFETEKYLPRIAEEIKKASGGATAVSLPAFIGINNYKIIRKKLEAMTGKFIYEIPSLPPSILGLRLDHALKNSFIRLGGEYIAGERVLSGSIKDNQAGFLTTRNSGNIPVKSKFFVLATGSFLSGGLTAGFDSITEPLFGLKVKSDNMKSKWYSSNFFDKKSQPFLSYGVETDNRFNPVSYDGKTIKNLFCAGSVLSGYNPVSEGCGGGVAVSTGFKCAERIIRELKND